MARKFTDVFDISSEDPAGTSALLGVANVRTRSTLYDAEIKNLERRKRTAQARGEQVDGLTNRLATVQRHNAEIEAEVANQRFVAETGGEKHLIYGQVTVGGVGKADLVVAAYDLEGQPVEPATVTEESGAYALVVEPPQPVRVVVSTRELEVLHCEPEVIRFEERNRHRLDVDLDTAEPVPVHPEYPCELDEDTGDGAGGDGDGQDRPRNVVMPDLAGMSLVEASNTLVGVGLVGDFTVVASSERDDVVTDQEVPPGHRVPSGSRVGVTVARLEQVKVPDVTGETAPSARARLEEHRLKAKVVETPHDAQTGHVFEQVPEAGDQAAPGSTVVVLVARAQAARELVEVPDVRGRTLGEAARLLGTVGLAIGDVETAGGAGDAQARVVTQDPSAGDMAAPGSRVDLKLRGESSERTRMPDLRGSRRQAMKALVELGVRNVRLKLTDEAAARASVVDQDPPPGAALDAGATVVLTVRPARSWRNNPGEATAQLFALTAPWLAAGAPDRETQSVAARLGGMPLDRQMELHARGPEALAEALRLERRELAEPLHAALAEAFRLSER